MAVIKGGEKLEAYLRDLSRKVTKAGAVKVGFFEGATEPNGASTAMIAAIQNFGAPKAGIPPRPFFSNMVKNNAESWGPALGKDLQEKNFDAAAALALLGDEIAGELRKAIIDTNSPPLSPVTLLLRARFGNNPQDITFADVMQARHDVASGTKAKVTPTQAKPLVWTGHLLNSVEYKVS